ncbi:Alpha-L-fucosidase 1 [Triticum urartu]|uniref:Alpha-L-fucosidase 1 n=1 Tax=Triticum urartu TaxID=4572 RepID=M7ZI17_TRIUA|nr:Alpha-L-fucosidase 1 [Triticum urartu]
MAQLHELLTRYGKVWEIWFDGNKGTNATKMTYHFQEWFDTVRQLQGSINIFSDAGPDIRWVGDENGFAGTTCWSAVNRSSITIGSAGIEKSSPPVKPATAASPASSATTESSASAPTEPPSTASTAAKPRPAEVTL